MATKSLEQELREFEFSQKFWDGFLVGLWSGALIVLALAFFFVVWLRY